MNSEQLIQSLEEQTQQIIRRVAPLKNEALDTLIWRENATSWNILECLEHLNLYSEFYLPEIGNKIKTSTTKSEVVFKSGFLGAYFAKSMLPKEKPNKMATFKDKNPLNAVLDKGVIDTFITQQTELLELLNQSRNVSLNKVKIPITISTFIKLKLGDQFQFFNNHIIRHLHQIENIQKAMKKQ